MCFIRHGLLAVGLFLIVAAGGTKLAKWPETDTKVIVPEYVVDAKELLGVSFERERS